FAQSRLLLGIDGRAGCRTRRAHRLGRRGEATRRLRVGSWIRAGWSVRGFPHDESRSFLNWECWTALVLPDRNSPAALLTCSQRGGSGPVARLAVNARTNLRYKYCYHTACGFTGEYPYAIFSAHLIDNLWSDYGERTRKQLPVLSCRGSIRDDCAGDRFVLGAGRNIA